MTRYSGLLCGTPCISGGKKPAPKTDLRLWQKRRTAWNVATYRQFGMLNAT